MAREVEDWHGLPREAVGSPSLEMFRFQPGPEQPAAPLKLSLL